MHKQILLGLFCGLVGLVAVAHADAPRYRVTKITDGMQKGQELGIAYGLNNHGDVVGRVDTRAFIWRQGKLTLLEMPEESQLQMAYHINDSRQVVGTYESAGRKGSYFFWDNGKIQKLGEAPWEIAYPDINNKGQVVFPIVYKNVTRAVFWQNGKRKDLGAFGPTGINDYAQIAGGQGPGQYGNMQSKDYWGVIWEEGQGCAAGNRESVAGFINNNRDYLLLEPEQTPRRYHLVQAGKRKDISPHDKSNILLYAMNDKCEIVGFAADGKQEPYAIFWRNGQWFDLNDLIPKDSGWVLDGAQDINNKGQIVGSGKHKGVPCAFLLTPIQ